MALTLPNNVAVAPRLVDLPRSAVMLDIARMAVGTDGVTPFFWPVARAEVEQVRNSFLAQLAETGRAQAAQGNASAHLLEIAALRWVTIVTRLFQASATVERFRRLGVPLELPPRMRLTQALSAGQELPEDPYIATLLNGPPKPQWWRAFAGEMRNRLRVSALRLRSFWRPGMNKAIVSCATGPILSVLAARADRPVYYLPHAVWFRPVTASELVAVENLQAELAGLAAAAAEAAFAAAGETLSLSLQSWLTRQFARSLAALSVHFDRLMQQPERLPSTLWTGANGNPYTRLLRRAVKRCGGTVIGHDHGVGAGVFQWPAMPLLEFIDCDRFVTFTKAHVATLRQSPGVEWMLTPHRPQIVAALDDDVRGIVAPTDARPATTPAVRRRILYMDPRFYGDRGHFVAWRSDIVVMDWMARLFAKLHIWGYDVVYKAHPEAPVSLPQQVRDALGVEIVTTPFENMQHDYDLILFDDPHSTTFPISLMSDKDVVVIDVGFMQWAPGAKELLVRRCPVVETWNDADNRLQIDWSALQDALRAASSRRDPGFVQTYFGSRRSAA